jgi:uncharacterized protein (TIGR02145 family)
MKTRSRAVWMILLAGAIFLMPLSCKKDSNDQQDNTIKIPSTTKVITASDWNANLISVDSASFTYVFNSGITATYGLNVGDVIVSDVGGGALRKITGIQTTGNHTTITTSFASLSEAVEDGSFSFDYQLTRDKIKSVKILDRACKVRPLEDKSGKNTNISYELSTFLDEDELVEIRATLTIDPSVSCSYQISHFKVKKMSILFTVEEQIEILATLTLLNIEWEKEKKLLEVKFAPITVMVGPVPVVITPEIEVNAGINLNINSAITSSVTQNLSYTVGIRYDNGNWSDSTDLNKGFGYNPPELSATAEAKAYLKPQFNLKIYEVLSPYLFAELYGRVEADLFANPWWSLYAGAGIGAGVKVEVWDITLIDYETDPPPILYEILIASAGSSYNEPPEVPSDPSPGDDATEVGIGSSLSWTCTDPDNDALLFDVYFGIDDPPPLVQSDLAEFTFNPGTLTNSTIYYWKIEAKDGHDHMTPGPSWTFATEASGGGTGEPCPGTTTVTYGGKVYHTALIGTQCWLKENLNIGTMINSSQIQADNGVIEKYCYQNQSVNCGIYGGLYQFDELMAYSSTQGAQGICPEGWHVASDDEWKTMEIALGMTPTEADLTGWRGTDQGTQLKPGSATGFDALMAGTFNLGFFSDLTVNGYFATSSSVSSTNAWARILNIDNPKISRYQTLKQNGISVRCVKD